MSPVRLLVKRPSLQYHKEALEKGEESTRLHCQKLGAVAKEKVNESLVLGGVDHLHSI